MDIVPPNIREVGQRAIEMTASWWPRPVDPNAVTPSELALAGVARCRRLLFGMLTLHDVAPDLVGGFARAHFETWVWSVYLLLDGDTAIMRLDANETIERRRQAAHIIECFESETGETTSLRVLVDDARQVLAATSPDAANATLSTLDATKQVVELLRATRDRNADYPLKMYALLYRRESQRSVHGQMAALRPHMPITLDGRGEVVAVPENEETHDRRLELTVAGFLALAKKAGEALELNLSMIETLVSEWFSSSTFTTSP